jgi:hypothetical protein
MLLCEIVMNLPVPLEWSRASNLFWNALVDFKDFKLRKI